MRSVSLPLLLALLLPLSGCYTVRYGTRAPAGTAKRELTAHFFLWGLAGTKDVDLDELCPDGGPAQWHNRASAGDVVLTLVTLGLYSPRTVTVECARVP